MIKLGFDSAISDDERVVLGKQLLNVGLCSEYEWRSEHPEFPRIKELYVTMNECDGHDAYRIRWYALGWLHAWRSWPQAKAMEERERGTVTVAPASSRIGRSE